MIIPNMAEINKSMRDLRNLTFMKVEWYGLLALSITLNDGQTCKAGANIEVNESHTFDRAKKITKIECIIENNEWNILQINFYHGEERLVAVFWSDNFVKRDGARVEVFEIAEDEQLIGCELHEYTFDDGDSFFAGVTWIKIKLTD